MSCSPVLTAPTGKLLMLEPADADVEVSAYQNRLVGCGALAESRRRAARAKPERDGSTKSTR
jgi:hypothetical protein